MMKLAGTYFYGNEASEYAKEHGYLDYATLAKAFDAVLNNSIINATCEIGYWEQESGFVENEEDEEDEDYCHPEIYQYYIVDDNGARILEECNEIVFYNEKLDMHVWGVTHYGTSWSYVLTDIKLNCGNEAV